MLVPSLLGIAARRDAEPRAGELGPVAGSLGRMTGLLTGPLTPFVARGTPAAVGRFDRRRETSMIGWVGDIERATLANETFRTVLFTGDHTQLTVMRLAPG
jgi:hypothetical protein